MIGRWRTSCLVLAVAWIFAGAPATLGLLWVQAADSRPTIVAPAPAQRDHLVRLSASGDFDSCVWFVTPLGAADGSPVDGGQGYVFAAPPGRYDVLLVFLRDGALGQASHTITVQDASPDPGPGPEVEAVPTVADIYGLGPRASDAVSAVKGLPVTRLRSDARAIGRAFLDVASGIEEGSYTEPNQAIKDTATQSLRRLGQAGWDRWQPWRVAVIHQVKGEYDSGRVKTLADLAQAFREVGTAMLSYGTPR